MNLAYTGAVPQSRKKTRTKHWAVNKVRATSVARPSTPTDFERLPNVVRSSFLFVVALLMLCTCSSALRTVLYLAGIFGAPLPSLIIHLHGAAFSCWILLLVTQTSLVAAGRVNIHRRLGIAGFILACFMVMLGVLAATDSLGRGTGPSGLDAKFFYVIPMTDMLIFATLVFFAFRARSNPAAHKRLILVATTALLIAALARWPYTIVHRKPMMAALASYIFLIILVAYDLWSIRKVHRATICAGAFLIFVQQIRIPIGKTDAWHAFAGWVLTLSKY